MYKLFSRGSFVCHGRTLGKLSVGSVIILRLLGARARKHSIIVRAGSMDSMILERDPSRECRKVERIVVVAGRCSISSRV